MGHLRFRMHFLWRRRYIIISFYSVTSCPYNWGAVSLVKMEHITVYASFIIRWHLGARIIYDYMKWGYNEDTQMVPKNTISFRYHNIIKFRYFPIPFLKSTNHSDPIARPFVSSIRSCFLHWQFSCVRSCRSVLRIFIKIINSSHPLHRSSQ